MDGAPSTPSNLSKVANIVLVLSGKGGVGKSTVACQLALALTHLHHKRVGLLDVDICGPSVPTICGLEGRDVFRDAAGWRPVPLTPDGVDGAGSLHVMSIAYLLPSSRDAVVWRGPKKDAMIKQFLTDVCWGELDYLIIDTPPGTSDEHLTLCEQLQPYSPSGAVIVTTPQDVSTDDVKKELSLCYKLHLRCLGIVENMSGFVCPHCAHCTDIFSRGGGAKLAQLYEVPFLGSLPIDPGLSIAEDKGLSFLTLPDSETITAVKSVVDAVVEQVLRVSKSQV